LKKEILIALLVITLAACAPMQPNTTDIQNTAVAMARTGVALTQTALPTATFPPPTFTPPVAFPTFESLPTQITPTALPTMTPLPASLPKFPLDGYIMLFTKDGDLYFQDEEATPVKLSHIGDPNYQSYYSPRLSDDNQKVVFS
jgi:hypothetical protein